MFMLRGSQINIHTRVGRAKSTKAYMDIPQVLGALPFALRGCTTPELPFDSEGRILLAPSMPKNVVSLVGSLCEPCVLFKYIDLHTHKAVPHSLILQALYSSINESLHTYTALVAKIEVQGIKSASDAYLKLASPTLYLRLFAAVVKAAEEKGNPFDALDLLADYRVHGDPLIRRYACQLYDAAMVPLNRIKREWEDFGSLHLDTFGEFYVRQSKFHPKQKHHDHLQGYAEFELVHTNLPKTISSQEALQSLELGTAVYFVREVCGVTDYDGKGKSKLEVNQYTHNLLMRDCKLMLHLRGLRDYMLLCSSNFVEALFRNDYDEFLTKQVAEVNSHAATNFYLGAIDDLTNPPQDDPEILQSIDAYVLGIGSGAKPHIKVWEAFVAQYHFSTPALEAIVGHAEMVKYERCFISLWRLRICLHSITESLGLLRQWGRHSADFDIAEQELYSDFTQLHNHFNATIVSIDAYLYYYIITFYWDQLERAMSHKVLTLPEITGAHSEYLEGIVQAVATQKRTGNIQEITRMVLKLQRWLESGIPEGLDLVEFQAAFDNKVDELNYHYDKA